MNMKPKKYPIIPLVFSALVFWPFFSSNSPAIAQIIPDNSLPNNSQVMQNGDIFTIDGGTTAGQNLFHSFQEFSLNTGNEAYFNNATTINNIIAYNRTAVICRSRIYIC